MEVEPSPLVWKCKNFLHMNKDNICIGIDPSAINRTSYGAISILVNGKLVESIKLNQPASHIMDKLKSYLDNSITTYAVIEKVWAMRGQAASSSFHFGYGCGMLELMLISLGVEYEFVTPQKWQKHFKMKKEKNESRASWKGRLCCEARELHSEYKYVKPICDSVLIARYCFETKI